jgi:D-arginine dehydrogenase
MKPSALIIGTGIAGASIAHALSKSHSVTVIETESSAGFHSTGRSAASLSTTSGLREVCALAEASRQFFMDPPKGFTEISLTSPKGLLWIGRDNSDAAALDELTTRNSEGLPLSQRIDAAQCKQILPQLRDEVIQAGGVWEPDCLTLDVAEVLAGYVRQSRASDAEFLFGTKFQSAEQNGSSTWQVTTSKGHYEADVLINAAGAWSDEVAQKSGLNAIPLQPYRRTAAIVKAPESTAHWPLTMDIGSRVYFEPESGGLLFSLSEETPRAAEDCKPEQEDIALALDRLEECVDLDSRHVIQSWAGLRTFAHDRLPIIGADPECTSFYWLSGQGGSGIKIAPAASELLQAEINGLPVPKKFEEINISFTTFSPDRFN